MKKSSYKFLQLLKEQSNSVLYNTLFNYMKTILFQYYKRGGQKPISFNDVVDGITYLCVKNLQSKSNQQIANEALKDVLKYGIKALIVDEPMGPVNNIPGWNDQSFSMEENKNTIMKQSQLKLLIENILSEMNDHPGTLEDYEIELKNCVIMGLSIVGDVIHVKVDIEYSIISSGNGEPHGQFGSTEKSYEASEPQVEINEVVPTEIIIFNQNNNDENGKQIEFESLTPAQKTSLEKSILKQVQADEPEITEKILNGRENENY